MQIGVNLAQKKQAGFVAGTRGGATSFTSATRFGDLKVNVEDLRELPLFKIISAIGIGILLNMYAEDYKNDLLEVENGKMDELRKEVGAIRKKEGELREFDRKRKSLEQDEQVIISKIETINKLVKARNNSINTLLFISKSMPEELWLKSIQINEGKIDLLGEAVQEEQIYDFLRKLNDGTFFEEVNPSAITSANIVLPSGNVDISRFGLSAKIVTREGQ